MTDTSGDFIDLGAGCEFNSTTTGTDDFIVGLAQPGKLTPEQSNVSDGKTYDYYAQTADGSQWESGSGTYTVSTHTQARTTITVNSNDDLSKVDFASPPIVDLFPSTSTSSLEKTVTQTGITNASGAAGVTVSTVVTFPNALPAKYVAIVQPGQGVGWFITTKTTFGFTVKLVPYSASVAVAAGTFDVAVIVA